jgi:large-conductance mechanosensitive channel
LAGEISSKLSKVREKDLSSYHKDSGEIIREMVLPGCGCAFWGLVFMAIPNIVCTFIGFTIIAIFIFIVVVRINKSQQISDLQKNEIDNKSRLQKNEVDNKSRIEEIKEKMKDINSLITSLSE